MHVWTCSNRSCWFTEFKLHVQHQCMHFFPHDIVWPDFGQNWTCFSCQFSTLCDFCSLGWETCRQNCEFYSELQWALREKCLHGNVMLVLLQWSVGQRLKYWFFSYNLLESQNHSYLWTIALWIGLSSDWTNLHTSNTAVSVNPYRYSDCMFLITVYYINSQWHSVLWLSITGNFMIGCGAGGTIIGTFPDVSKVVLWVFHHY